MAGQNMLPAGRKRPEKKGKRRAGNGAESALKGALAMSDSHAVRCGQAIVGCYQHLAVAAERSCVGTLKIKNICRKGQLNPVLWLLRGCGRGPRLRLVPNKKRLNSEKSLSDRARPHSLSRWLRLCDTSVHLTVTAQPSLTVHDVGG